MNITLNNTFTKINNYSTNTVSLFSATSNQCNFSLSGELHTINTKVNIFVLFNYIGLYEKYLDI